MNDRHTVGVSHIVEARRTAMTSIEDWEYLSDEEKHGTLHEIVDQLAKAEGKVDE